MNEEKAIEILLVEDNPGDVLLTKKAFEKSKIANHIHVAGDGEIAMEMLRKENGYRDYPRPDIVLLDINMPKKDGKQVLAEMKEDHDLCRIPVVVLTSSKAERDVLKSYELHASSYIIKPINLPKFYDVIAAIEDFWFKVVALPPLPNEQEGDV